MQRTAQDMVKGFDSVTASINKMQTAMSSRKGGGKGNIGNLEGNDIQRFVKKAQDALTKLRTAYTSVNTAITANDKEQEKYWRGRMQSISQFLDAYTKGVQDEINKISSSGNIEDTGLKNFSIAIRDIREQMKLQNSVRTSRDTTTDDSKKQAAELKQISEAYTGQIDQIKEYNRVKDTDKAAADTNLKNIQEYIAQYDELAKKLKDGTFTGSSLEKAERTLRNMNNAAKDFIASMNASEQQKPLQQIKSTYDALVRTIREYQSQLKAGDFAGAENTKKDIEALIQSYEKLEQLVKSGAVPEKDLESANAVLQNMRTEMNKFAAETQKANAQVSTMGTLISDVGQRLARVATQAIMRGLSNMWRDAIDYTKTYYDALNEIRIVTMRSQEDADALGARYRENARELSVTSAEYVQGAASLFRQGLGDEDVEGRLRQITIAAKTWGLDVAETTELMTVAINAFNDGIEDSSKTAERIADVYSYVGRQNCPLAA